MTNCEKSEENVPRIKTDITFSPHSSLVILSRAIEEICFHVKTVLHLSPQLQSIETDFPIKTEGRFSSMLIELQKRLDPALTLPVSFLFAAKSQTGETMIIYADWGDKKEWVTLTKESPENIYYLEEGCPLQPLIELLNTNYKIFKIPGTETTRIRKERGLEKTDEVDVALIRELAETCPELFVEITSIEKLDMERKLKVQRYCATTKMLVMIKNQEHSMEKQFGHSESLEKVIKFMEADKANQIEDIKPYIQRELDALSDVVGCGPALVSQICAMAHPARFLIQQQYLIYCGFIDPDKLSKEKRHKYNRAIKPVYYNLLTQQMLHSGPYKTLYEQIKEKELKNTCSSCRLGKPTWSGKACKSCKSPDQLMCNGSAHSRAQNKVMTALVKLVYSRLKDLEFSDWRLPPPPKKPKKRKIVELE